MKTSSRQEWFSLAGLFCAGALVAQTADSANPAAAAGAAAPARNQQPSAQEKEVDLQHLQRIYQAIVAYYKDHQDLPNWLSDLVPNYLPDANDLLSPVEKRTGKSVLYGRDDPKLHTSYIYEFNAGAAAEEFNRTRAVPLTCKEWKLMQIKKFGLVTPMLRCHLHNPVLNVSYNGQIFETGLLWENDPRTAALIRKNPQLGPKPGEAAGPRVTIKITDDKTDAVIADASVRATLGSEFGLLPPTQTQADTNGIVTINTGEWSVNFLILTATHPLYKPARVDWNRGKDGETVPSEMTVKLARRDEAQAK